MSGVSIHEGSGTIAEQRVADSTAQVWAYDRRTGRYVFMRPGAAEQFRTDARLGHLVCPVPLCPDSKFLAVGKTSDRRHHFRHASGHRHSPETINHVQAKAMLTEWAYRLAPDARVQEEATLKEPLPVEGYLNRRADVGIEWANGNRLAIEVEYKLAEVTAMRQKQADYAAAQIGTTWLFGSVSRHLRPRYDGQFRVSDAALALAQAGVALLCIDPVEQTVGTLVCSEEAGSSLVGTADLRLVGPEDRFVQIETCALDDCRLDERLGLVTPVMDEIYEAREKGRLLEEAAARANAARSAATELCDDDPSSYADRVAGQPPIDVGDMAQVHCGPCAYRMLVGLPVRSRPHAPTYVPWRNWAGDLIAAPPAWAPGGRPFGQHR